MVLKSNVFDRLGVSGHDQKNSRTVCRFWKVGKCTHQPCRYFHGESPSAAPSPSPYRRSNVYNRGGSQYSSQQPRSNVYIRPSPSKPPPSTPVDSRQRDSPKQATLQKPNNVSDEKIILIAEDDQKKSEEETICGE